ncbi:MAG TPA: permease [Opitutae bacterium]|nr:permease [Opitutae bacterium]
MKEEYYASPTAAQSSPAERAGFIRKTYGHLAIALLAFTGIEYYLVNAPFAQKLAASMTQGMSWLVVMGLFVGVSYLTDKLARSNNSEQTQYLGLGLFVVAEAIVFLPLLYVANSYGGEGVIQTAGIMTLLLVGGLTYTAFATKKDFSFLGGILSIGGFVAIGFIVCSLIFGFSLGLIFSSVMVLFAGCAVLFTTSNIIHHYNPNQHVAASLSLFASVALLFFYILSILLRLGGDD